MRENDEGVSEHHLSVGTRVNSYRDEGQEQQRTLAPQIDTGAKIYLSLSFSMGVLLSFVTYPGFFEGTTSRRGTPSDTCEERGSGAHQRFRGSKLTESVGRFEIKSRDNRFLFATYGMFTHVHACTYIHYTIQDVCEVTRNIIC